jgi:hypothetical protein
MVRFCEREAEHLGEARLARAEEAGDPDGDALVRLVGRLPVARRMLECSGADGVRDDVLADLLADDGFVGLVDLDDLFDATVDVVGEERVRGSGFGVRGSGFRVQGSGVRVQGFSVLERCTEGVEHSADLGHRI